MKLSDKEIKYILNELEKSGVTDHLLQDELCDHICCAVEEKLDTEISFEDTYRQIIASFGEQGLIGVQEQTRMQFFEKYFSFRNLLLASFIILITGFFLKLFQLPGAGICYLSATVIYFIAIFRLSFLIIKEKSFPKYRLYFGLVLITYIIIWFTVQKFGGNAHPVSYLFIPVIFFFGLLCLFHFSSKLKSITNAKLKTKYLFFISLSIFPTLLCLIDILNSARLIQIDFARSFFWLITMEFVLTFVYLLFIQYFKNIAVLTLLLAGTLFYLPFAMPVLLSKLHINKSKQVAFVVNTHQKNQKNIYLIDKSLYLGFDKIKFQKQNDTTFYLQFNVRDKWQLFYAVTSDERNIKDIMNSVNVEFKKLFANRDTVLTIIY